MVKRIVISIVILVIASCQYRIREVNGEEVFVGSPHRLHIDLDKNYHNIIDTNAVYVDIDDYYWYLKFDSNGSLIRANKSNFALTPEDFRVSPKSTDRGRYLVKGNKIKIEVFGPGDTFFSNVLLRSVWKGKIKGDTLNLKHVNGTYVFVKSNSYYFEDGVLKRVAGK